MSDKMRGALFNMLGDISGLTVLDPFAGTGALSFEAISRGAASVLAIEKDRKAQRTIDENIISLRLDESVRLIKASCQAWLSTSSEAFDLVLLDPPYDAIPMTALNNLAARLNDDGILVLSWPGGERPPQLANLKLIKSKQYGDASLHIYEA